MSLKALAKKLRDAADVLDNLLYESERENRTTAKSIIKKYKKHKKHKGYHGTHWTQLPKNRAKLSKMIKDSTRTRMEMK